MQQTEQPISEENLLQKTLSLIFYIEQDQKYQYVYSNGKQNEKDFFQTNLESFRDNNGNFTFGLSRFIVENIDENLYPESLLNKEQQGIFLSNFKNITQQQSNQDQNQKNSPFQNPFRLFTNKVFDAWNQFLCKNDNQQYQLWNDDYQKKFIYFLKIDQEGYEILQTIIQSRHKKELSLGSFDEIQKLNFNLFQTLGSQLQNFDEILNTYKQLYNSSNNNTKLVTNILIQTKPKLNNNLPYQWPQEAIFRGLYQRKFELWYTYNQSNYEYPTEQILENANFIIIAGSKFSSYNTDDFIIKQKAWLTETYNKYKNVKILCHCYGAQLFADTFGGKVEPLGRYIRQPVECHFNQKFFQLDFLKNYQLNEQQKTSFKIQEAHGDTISQIPQFCEEFARSSDGLEAFASQDGRVLAFQCHPEYDTKFHFLLQSLLRTKNFDQSKVDQLYDEIYQQYLSKKEFYDNYHDNNEMREIIQRFLINKQ